MAEKTVICVPQNSKGREKEAKIHFSYFLSLIFLTRVGLILCYFLALYFLKNFEIFLHHSLFAYDFITYEMAALCLVFFFLFLFFA